MPLKMNNLIVSSAHIRSGWCNKRVNVKLQAAIGMQRQRIQHVAAVAATALLLLCALLLAREICHVIGGNISTKQQKQLQAEIVRSK